MQAWMYNDFSFDKMYLHIFHKMDMRHVDLGLPV